MKKYMFCLLREGEFPRGTTVLLPDDMAFQEGDKMMLVAMPEEMDFLDRLKGDRAFKFHPFLEQKP